MEPTLIKTTSLGAVIASFILWLFQVPPEAFMAGLICAVIGEFAKKSGGFKNSAIAVIAVAILTGFIGKAIIDKMPGVSPTSICGILAFSMTYYRSKVEALSDTFFGAAGSWVTNFFKRGGESD